MAIAATMSHNNDEKDDHDHDMVMPGFRFHPTEEELIEFYLRRKVEGKRFNVELITFLDLYRHDPWELPALAAIGEKEWFFYVPRDRKYRNGDRPNRVTTSGYWKATGADRTIRTENGRSIGLKKTLVFYSGKAPKGIRTSWIMNEYRLPQHETDRNQKAEISLCRVYKRAGVDDHSPVIVAPTPSLLSSVRPPSSSSSSSSYSRGRGGGGIIESHSQSESEGKQLQSNNMVHCSIAPSSFQGIETTHPPLPTDNRLIDHHQGIWTALGLANHHRASPYNEGAAIITTPPSVVSVVEEEAGDQEDDEKAETLLLQQQQQQQHHSVHTKQVVVGNCSLIFPSPPLPPCIATSSTHPHHFFNCSSSSSSISSPVVAVDDLRRLVDYQHVAAVAAAAYSEQQRQHQQQQQAYNFLQQQQPLIVPSESHLLPPPSFHHQHHQEKLWEWRSTTIPDQSNPENTDQDFPITTTTTTPDTHHQFK